jgi:hypothetical protein
LGVKIWACGKDGLPLQRLSKATKFFLTLNISPVIGGRNLSREVGLGNPRNYELGTRN